MLGSLGDVGVVQSFFEVDTGQLRVHFMTPERDGPIAVPSVEFGYGQLLAYLEKLPWGSGSEVLGG